MAKVALLIGVSEYEPGLNALPAAVHDVEAMRRVLRNSEMGGFADEDITVLKNPEPQKVRNAIYNLFANRKRDDLVLFYFSGHGIKDEKGKLYLSTRATRKQNGKLVKPSSIPASVLHESINDS
ncbi:MAG: caspase family protein, partial [Cyanobacteria bacterium P01_A01_bin.68]